MAEKPFNLVDGIKVYLTGAEIAAAKVRGKAWADGAFDRAIIRLRLERNLKLAETDWWASTDLVISVPRKAYRQALRDLPTGLTTEFKVKNVKWPTSP